MGLADRVRVGVCAGGLKNLPLFVYPQTLTVSETPCFLKTPKHGNMYASRVEPEAQRPLDSPSNGLPLNLFAIFGWPLGDSGVRPGEQVRFAGICCSLG